MAKYHYDGWGNLYKIEKTNNTEYVDIANELKIRNHMLYKGYYYDVETGLYYCNSRYYSPELCRWISLDSVDYLDPESINGLNLYAYCNNDPVNYYDPTGHWAIPNWLKWVIGGVVIVGLGIATIATGGAAAGVAGYIVAGAFKGAVIGAFSGALVSGTIGGIASTVNGDGFWSGLLMVLRMDLCQVLLSVV